MGTIALVLIVLALVAFVAGAFNFPSRINLVSAGLGLLTAALLIGRLFP